MQALNLMRKYKKAFFFCFLLALIAIVYFRSLKYDYTYFDDDVLVILNHDFISNYKNIPKFFLKGAFYTGDNSFYRPILTLSFSIDSMIAGKNPFMYHLTGLLLHISAVFLIFVFLRKLEFNEMLVFLFTSIFAVHPAFAHAVAWIPGRNDLLLTVFVLLSLIFLFDYFNKEKKNTVKIFMALFLFALAVFTKESASTMVAVMPVFMFLFCKNIRKKDYIVVFTASALIFCAYIGLRIYVLTGNAAEITFDFLKTIKSILIYCEYLVIPYRIYLFPDNIDLNFLTFFSSLMAFVPLMASLFFNIGRKKVILFGAFWCLVFLMPSFMASERIISFLPHRLYVISTGFIIMFIEFFSSASEKFKPAGKYVIFLLFIFISLFTWSSCIHVKKFQNKYIYISHAISEQPQSNMLRCKMAQYYAENGKYEEARRELAKVTSKDGTYSSVYYEMAGYVFSLEGRYDRAIELFEQLIELFPKHESALNNMSEIYFLKGEYGKALGYAERLIEIRPERSDYKIHYAKIKNKYDNISENK
ncbi:MAG: DUF6056 family protein [Endomicrobium sp.]|jgi:tetratricopeptide (TPR) repeat protein|nr:DUF6056 family protein [Endomicrobium sp.]